MTRNKEIGARIKAKRILKRWSAEKLAEGLGVSRQTILNIEAGRFNTSLQKIMAIAELLKCHSSELISSERGADKLSPEAAKNLGAISQLPPEILKTMRKLGSDIHDLTKKKNY